jgi:hypothetical protein
MAIALMKEVIVTRNRTRQDTQKTKRGSEPKSSITKAAMLPEKKKKITVTSQNIIRGERKKNG